MTRALLPAVAALGAAVATAAGAAPGGQIGRLPLGSYVCEVPGNATGAAGIRVPEQGFTVINATTYTSQAGRGTYLLTGDLLTMTSGPKHGQKFHVLSLNFLREIGPDGKDGTLRCVRRVINNG